MSRIVVTKIAGLAFVCVGLCAAGKLASAQDAVQQPAVATSEIPAAVQPAPATPDLPAPAATVASAPTVAASSTPAPTRIAAGAKVCIQADDDVRSLVQSAFMKKGVPVVLVTACEKADFMMTIPHYEQHTDKAAVKVTKLLLFGASGDNFQMDAVVTNRDSAIIFAKTVKRRDSKVAAQDLAKWFGEYVKSGKIT